MDIAWDWAQHSRGTFPALWVVERYTDSGKFSPLSSIFVSHSVAELCVKRRYGVDKLDQDSREDNKVSKRQLFALRIRRGQKSIFQRICELVDENSVPEEQ